MAYRSSIFFNPWREINRLQRSLENLMNENLFEELEPLSLQSAQPVWRPACDIDETDDHYLVSFDLPGVSREEIRIECRDHQLVVSGERSGETRRTGEGTVTRERFSGGFMRSFQLPSAVKAEQVQANLSDGVLRIAIPKAESAQRREIAIGTGHSGFFEKLLPHRKGERAEKAEKGEKVA
jgi:HSP20 family protein